MHFLDRKLLYVDLNYITQMSLLDTDKAQATVCHFVSASMLPGPSRLDHYWLNRKWSHHSADSLSQAQKWIPYSNYWPTHNSMHALILIQPIGNEVITMVTACHRPRNESHILIIDWPTTRCMLSYWYNQQEIKSSRWWQPVTGPEINPIF